MTTLQPRPAVGSPTPWDFPQPTETMLVNGIRVLRFDLPGQHVASVDVFMDAPLNLEPRDREGVATLTLRCSDEGTLDHPGAAISALLEAQGASYSGEVDAHGTLAGIQVPAHRLGAALPLLADVIARPALAAEDVQRHIALRLSQIDRTVATAAGASSLAFRQAVFSPNSRQSRPTGGLRESVGRLTRQDLLDYHRSFWRPEAATIIIGGDLPAGVDESIAAAFESWQSESAQHSHRPPEGNADPRRVWVVDRPGSVQADLRIGALATDRRDPDWVGLRVAADALGGSFGSRLNRRLREERGYTYGISCAFAPLRSRGTFSLSASCRTEVAVDATVEALALLDLADDPLRPEEVADAINHLVGVAPLRFDTADAIVEQAAALVSAGLDVGWIDRYYAATTACTPEQATEAFVRHVRPQDLHIVLCGDASALVRDLTERGLTPQVVVPAS